ncbi:MAG: leucine-rich repeat domain-containing protein, partial [Eubacterium sp.]
MIEYKKYSNIWRKIKKMGKVKYRVLAILTLFTVLGGTLFSLPGYAAGAGPTFTQQFNPEGTEAGAHTAEVVAAACGSTVDTVIDAAMIEKTTLLDLRRQGLTQIDGIEIFSNLESLDLNGNQLTSLPDSIGNLEQLEMLDLSENQLTSLPESIGNLVNLQILGLISNQLTSLPESIENLVNLEWLYLSRNQLTSLPESIGKLTSLKILVLGSNQLTSLPDSIGNLEKLQELQLWNNQLISLPDSIGNLVNLQILYLNGNQLTSLSESIGNLVELQLLYLNDNQLTSLPESIGNLKNLNRELMLGHNLLPTGYAATLNRLHEGWSFPEEPQDQLILKTEGLPRESIRTQADLA